MTATARSPIILYDIPSNTELNAWSINMWKTRLLLNLKGLPYRTEWVSYPDIEPTFEKLGIKHTSLKSDGRPHFTCPAIIDPITPEPTKISDSTAIALYLEDTYPDVGPQVFPGDTKDAQLEFIEIIHSKIFSPISSLQVASLPAILDPPGSEYIYRTRTASRGKPLDTVCEAGSEERRLAWEELKHGLHVVAETFDKNIEGKGEYFIGTAITYVDIFLAATCIWTRMPSDRDRDVGVNSVWEGIAKLDGGRWAQFMEKFEDLLQVK
ncbi:hypothetical protein FRB90_005714 [Tulasnella sp. 427]|nr:hypothetical protein FRB90_005714 [Tulasnella sp. 427]